MLDNVVAEEMRPRTPFEDDDDHKWRLMSAVDAINERHGCWTAVPTIQRFRHHWRVRAENRSPAWTTRIGEVPVMIA